MHKSPVRQSVHLLSACKYGMCLCVHPSMCWGRVPVPASVHTCVPAGMRGCACLCAQMCPPHVRVPAYVYMRVHMCLLCHAQGHLEAAQTAELPGPGVLPAGEAFPPTCLCPHRFHVFLQKVYVKISGMLGIWGVLSSALRQKEHKR